MSKFLVPGNRQLYVDEAGTLVVLGGKVGIGVAAPAEALEVEDGHATTGIQISNTATDGDPILAFALSGTKTFTLGVDDGDSDKFKIGTSAIGTDTRLTIDSTGRVGIGTESPSQKLEVALAGSPNRSLFVNYSDTAADSPIFLVRKSHTDTLGSLVETIDTEVIGKFEFQGVDGASTAYEVGSIKMEQVGAATATNVAAKLSLSTSNTAGRGVRMTIDPDGNVGIKTASPTAQLHVDQSSTTGAQPVLLLDQADVNEDYFKFIGTSDTSADRALVDAANFTTPGAIVGWLKINVQDDQGTAPIPDGDYYISFSAAPTA